MIKLPDIKVDFALKTHDSEIDIQYFFEQYKGSTKLSFTSQLSLQFSIILGNYLKFVKNITHLDIKILPNQISSAGISGIAKGLWFLENLNYLSLEIQNNNISEQGCWGLCQGLQTLQGLKTFYLIIGECNYIKDQGVEAISQSIKHLFQLEKLALVFQENQLGSDSGQHLGQGIKDLKKLKKFLLTIEPGNQILSEGAQGISKGLRQLNNLEVLQIIITHNKIGKVGFDSLGEALYSLKSLQKLSLSLTQVNIKLNESNAISQAVKKLTNLNYLFLDIQKDQEIGSSISNLVNLSYLNIKLSDKIGLLGVINFGQGLKRLSNLNELYILVEKFNNTQVQGVQEICESLKNLQNLQKLSFIIENNNSIQSEGAVHIGNSLKFLKKLKYLKLHILRDNNISFEGAQKIGESFSELQNLQTLNLEIGDLNHITSQGLISISEGISNQMSLQDLKIIVKSQNQINNQQGYNTFSKNINKLKQLTNFHFEIGCENLSQIGEIYTDMKNLQKLSIIIATENHIRNSAGIGLGFHNLTNLTNLTLQIDSGNELGEDGVCKIATGLSHLLNLTHLRLTFGSKNHVKNGGVIGLGRNISALKKLEELYLQIFEDNQIGEEGILSLSSELSKLQSLKKLDLNIYEPYVISAIALLENNTSLTNEMFNLSNMTRNEFYFQRSTKEELELLKIPYYFNMFLNCNLSGVGQGLKLLSSLTSLTIQQYKQKPNILGLTDLYHSIQELPNLRSLEVSFLNCPFPCELIRKLCECFGKLVNLESLTFIINQLVIEEKEKCQIPSLGTSLKKLVNLQKLCFNINYEFAEESYKKLGYGINSLKNLQSLEFLAYDYKQVQGWFSEIKNLKTLILNYKFETPSRAQNTTMFQQIFNEISHIKTLNCFKIINYKGYIMGIFQFPVLNILNALRQLRYFEINNSTLKQEKQHLLNQAYRTQKRLISLKI
ncbi:hypothetical protein TTHERM_00079510 (macronuclear) [Tetrahymena thermophila SB210]|uniref:Kinase domain protein n=1 Tax=Tetrahymena thermophila (strain SB210) TaxID=312017 RepID=Q23FR4_TETTS|nr:hypothetical protein TTHERM_00079510 [Tetrahymena thermophila SB210]EAR95546.1 hypothetical protein TTHERM_00079510 [Tetrahymena thermophila SB210]|eukprot:XP_001015791.1 hypothetical protein TTHERM_00079510 [Tetrahymena thermophila SB210]